MACREEGIITILFCAYGVLTVYFPRNPEDLNLPETLWMREDKGTKMQGYKYSSNGRNL